MKRGERQNDEIHYLLDRGAKEQTAHQRVLGHKTQLATRPIVNRRRGARDKEMQEDTQNVGAGASTDSLPPQQAGGDHKWNLPSK